MYYIHAQEQQVVLLRIVTRQREKLVLIPSTNKRYSLDIVGTVYHLVIYMQFNKIHKVFYDCVLFITYVSSTCFGPHRSIIRSVLYKLYVQIWYVVISILRHIPNLHIQLVNKRS